MSPLRSRLREATAAAHARVDGLWAGAGLAERGTYISFLRATAAAMLPMERHLDQAGARALLPDWDSRLRAPSLSADLTGLGTSPPSLLPPPDLGSAAALWGALYVLEGSRLGGKVLLRQVQASPDPVVRDNARFLAHGASASFWPSFIDRLETADPAPTPTEVELICAGACATFGLFEVAARSERNSVHV